MIDKHKIRLMTRLAIYDKKFGNKDNKINSYFKWDYIYIKNFWTRICAFIGFCIFAGFYALDLLFIQKSEIFGMDYQGELTKLAVLAVVTLVFYTALSTVLSFKEYEKMLKRREKYFQLLDRLDLPKSEIKSTGRDTNQNGSIIHNKNENNKFL